MAHVTDREQVRLDVQGGGTLSCEAYTISGYFVRYRTYLNVLGSGSKLAGGT